MENKIRDGPFFPCEIQIWILTDKKNVAFFATLQESIQCFLNLTLGQIQGHNYLEIISIFIEKMQHMHASDDLL